nr:astacin protein [Hymenolepis microstoma]
MRSLENNQHILRMHIIGIAFALMYVTTSAEKPEKSLIRSRRAVIPVNAIPWPNNRIPYIIDRQYFDKNELRDLQSSIDVWNSETCVKFMPFNRGDKSWVRITDGTSCYSQYMGYKGTPGEQIVTLSRNGCRFYGLYLHELGHAIGLDHEHIRTDRDEYLKVDTAGVPDNLKSFFTRKTKNQLLVFDAPYDLQSVMHYGQSSFSVFADKAPIDVKDSKLRPLLKDVYVKDVSFWDVRAVNLNYDCKGRCRGSKPKCEFPGFIDKNCKCQTLEGFAKRRCVDNYGTSNCAKLADRLECYRNSSFMTANCRKTCGFCYVVKLSDLQKAPIVACKDHHEYCKDWSREGQCVKTASYMEMMCPESCGYCNKAKSSRLDSVSSNSAKNVDENCKDRYRYPADCEAWAKEGKCESNKLWMHFSCAKSCGVCRPSIGSKKTTSKPALEITATATVTTTTKKETGTTPPCKDLYGTVNCQSLAARNMCKSNKSWMAKQCPLTCGFCHLGETTPKPMTTTTIRTTIAKKPKAMITATTAHPMTTQLIETTNATKKTKSRMEKIEVANATVQYLEYCKIGDPPGKCPKYRANCRTAERFRECPNVCQNCE